MRSCWTKGLTSQLRVRLEASTRPLQGADEGEGEEQETKKNRDGLQVISCHVDALVHQGDLSLDNLPAYSSAHAGRWGWGYRRLRECRRRAGWLTDG